MKFCIAILAALVCASTSLADTWGDAEAWVYKPKYIDFDQYGVVEWIVKDSTGKSVSIYYNNSDGSVNADSLKTAMDSLKLSVSSVFQNMAYMAQDVVLLNAALAQMDQDLADLDAKLDNVFAQVFGKLNTLEEKLNQPTDSGGVSSGTKTVEKTIVEKTTEKIVVAGGISALKVDGKSIGVKNEGTDSACYQMKNYTGVNGYIPIATTLSGLIWDQPKSWFDASSLDCDVNTIDVPEISGARHGVHLAGWYGEKGHTCSEDIATQLESGGDTHYVLTKNKSNGALHYTDIGKMAAGGYAIKFVGTDSNAVILGAPATKTNQVTFASASDSNVSAIISGNANAVTITIGVYYK